MTTIPSSVPVTILTGFLGAGKTTLLNYILTQSHGYRIAVIQNEFGESIGVENEMLVKTDDSTLLQVEELSNGCICCSIRDSLVTTLEKIMEKRHLFDYVLIETTGLANPGPIVSSFWLDEDLLSCLYLDAIVTVVDGHNIGRHLDGDSSEGSSEVVEQLAFADCILLNKMDLVGSDKDATEIEHKIREVNAVAAIHRTTRSQLDLSKLLNLKAFDPNVLEQHHHGIFSNDHRHHDDNDHIGAKQIETIMLVAEKPIESLDAFNRWMGRLLWEKGAAENILRMKGMLYINGEDTVHILQGVHEIFDVQSTRCWNSDEAKSTKIILIGKKLDKDAFQQGLFGITI